MCVQLTRHIGMFDQQWLCHRQAISKHSSVCLQLSVSNRRRPCWAQAGERLPRPHLPPCPSPYWLPAPPLHQPIVSQALQQSLQQVMTNQRTRCLWWETAMLTRCRLPPLLVSFLPASLTLRDVVLALPASLFCRPLASVHRTWHDSFALSCWLLLRSLTCLLLVELVLWHC